MEIVFLCALAALPARRFALAGGREVFDHVSIRLVNMKIGIDWKRTEEFFD